MVQERLRHSPLRASHHTRFTQGRWPEQRRRRPGTTLIVLRSHSRLAGTASGWPASRERAGIEAYVIHAASVAVSREHRRPKADRLDTEGLKRAGPLQDVCDPELLGGGCQAPHRERETLVGERTTIVNSIKATLARLGIRSFNPKLKKAPDRLEHLRTPEGEPIPPNTLAELQRDLARKQLVAEQIRQIEKARLKQLQQAPKARANLMVLVLMRVIGIETADMLVKEILSRNLRDRCGAHRLARRKRKDPPREGACPSRQCSGASWDEPTRLALSRVPKGQRLGQVV
jgi:hypothetical protein